MSCAWERFQKPRLKPFRPEWSTKLDSWAKSWLRLPKKGDVDSRKRAKKIDKSIKLTLRRNCYVLGLPRQMNARVGHPLRRGKM